MTDSYPETAYSKQGKKLIFTDERPVCLCGPSGSGQADTKLVRHFRVDWCDEP